MSTLARPFGDCREGQKPRCPLHRKFDVPLFAAGFLTPTGNEPVVPSDGSIPLFIGHCRSRGKSPVVRCGGFNCTQLFLFYHAFCFFAIKKVDRKMFFCGAVLSHQLSCFTLSDMIDSTSSLFTLRAAASSRYKKSSARRK